MFVNYGHPIRCIERLANKTNQQISCCQTTIQEFGRWMKGRYPSKGNKDKKCCDGKKNVDCVVIHLPKRESILVLQPEVFVCALPSVKFIVVIVLQSCPLTCSLFTIAVRVNEESPSQSSRTDKTC